MNDRQTHIDLIDQVAESTEERDEVRRVLSEPLTEADIDAQERYKRAPFALGRTNHAHRFSACASGPCKGGTKLCPSPEACQRADAPASDNAGRVITGVVVLVTAALMAAAIVHVALRLLVT